MQNAARYLDRIGLTTSPTLSALHLAHVTSIPFENLDPLQGGGIDLDPSVLEHKLVLQRRGGYCFEQNLLFADALPQFGITEIAPILARVRAGGRPGIRPKTHCLLKVQDEGRTWLVDVGFGADGPLLPVPYITGEVTEQFGWRYRIIEDRGETVLQMEQQGQFIDLYGFVDERALPIDIEVSNWYVSTSPRSPFTTALHCARKSPQARWLLSERSGQMLLTTSTPDGREILEVDRSEVPLILNELFDIGDVIEDKGRWRRSDNKTS